MNRKIRNKFVLLVLPLTLGLSSVQAGILDNIKNFLDLGYSSAQKHVIRALQSDDYNLQSEALWQFQDLFSQDAYAYTYVIPLYKSHPTTVAHILRTRPPTHSHAVSLLPYYVSAEVLADLYAQAPNSLSAKAIHNLSLIVLKDQPYAPNALLLLKSVSGNPNWCLTKLDEATSSSNISLPQRK